MLSVVIFIAIFTIHQVVGRIDPSQRKFRSSAVDQQIEDFRGKFKDDYLFTLFENAYPNTLDTTISSFLPANSSFTKKLDTFVITGDITAMWLRDSCNQVLPYLRFANKDENLKNLLKGVVNRHIYSVNIDPYANAFNYDNTKPSPHRDDHTTMVNDVFERKYEVDSIAAMLKISYYYYNYTGDIEPYDNDYINAVKKVISTVTAMQSATDPDKRYPYSFSRDTTRSSETLQDNIGYPSAFTNLTRSPFRPSDDATLLAYFIPGNAMLAVELKHTADLIEKVLKDNVLAKQCRDLGNSIEYSIYQYGKINITTIGEVISYETDGFGSHIFMDDANIPSLLSLPYLGFINQNDKLYLNTRKALLSNLNPYWFHGSAGEGIGGPHCGFGYFWPMSVIMRALTTDNDEEIVHCLDIIKNTAPSGFINECVWYSDVSRRTRPWFAWANSLYGELILKLSDTKPHLLFK